jgi:hypothetical protein
LHSGLKPFVANFWKRNPILYVETEEVQIIESFKQSIITAPVLVLPSLEKPFHLFVNVGRE